MILTAISMNTAANLHSTQPITASKSLKRLKISSIIPLRKGLSSSFIIKTLNIKQSNIGLVTSDEDSYNTGGFSRIIKNKVMLYYEGDHVAI